MFDFRKSENSDGEYASLAQILKIYKDVCSHDI